MLDVNDIPARIRNEVRVEKSLTPTHRHVQFTVGKRHVPGVDLVTYVRALLPRYEIDFIQRWCEQGFITVNGIAATSGHLMETGQIVVMHVPLPPLDPSFVPPPLKIAWHDEHLAVVIKQPGHLAHQAGKIMTGTLINQLQDWALESGRDPHAVRLVNRIDRDTSGLVLASLDLTAHIGISKDMELRRIHKQYLAICHGQPADAHGHWQDPIGDKPGSNVVRMVRPDGQSAHTEFEIADTVPSGAYSLLKITLHTGRQHQIRIHAAYHGHPLVGDWMYGTSCAELSGQALHAAELSMTHPITGDALHFQAPLPASIAELWQLLKTGAAVTTIPLNAGQRARLGLYAE